MWKLLLAFAVFAALAIFLLMKGGGNIDLSGEKHDVAAPATETAASAPAPQVAASGPTPASAASQ